MSPRLGGGSGKVQTVLLVSAAKAAAAEELSCPFIFEKYYITEFRGIKYAALVALKFSMCKLLLIKVQIILV